MSNQIKKIETQELVQGAVILVAALAWNEAARSMVTSILPFDSTTSRRYLNFTNVIYAIVVTVMLMFVISMYNYSSDKVTFDPNAKIEKIHYALRNVVAAANFANSTNAANSANSTNAANFANSTNSTNATFMNNR